ncbi:MAG: thiamine pyrophosphate-binding protein [Streptosporangiales bacterium]|nr:thiamine pyrophosphate-binding protein [Streptosporangiales bacterium]
MINMTANAAEAIVDLLARAGVRRFYTVPGESFLELLDAVAQHPELRLVSTRHESGAAFMAEADAKITGVPAVAMGTRGPGAANLAVGVHTAHQDSTPMIVLLGHVETEFFGREAFQEVDLARFYDPITVYAATVQRSDRAAETVARALRHATAGRPGPAMVALPADLLAGQCSPVDLPFPEPPMAHPSPQDVALAADELTRAARPVAILGRGAHDLHDKMVHLAEAYGLGVYTGFRRQDTFPASHPHYLGHLGLGTPDELLEPLRTADVVLVLGSRLSEATTQGYALPRTPARVIQVDVDPLVLGATTPVARGVLASVESFADALLARPASVPRRDWSAAHNAAMRLSDPEGMTSPHGIHPAEVVAAMRRRLPADTVLTNDAGNFSIFGHRYWRFDHPRSQAAPTSGAMGYAVPGAVGAQLAAPDRRVAALVGDGGFLMTGQEMETAVRLGLPVLAVVFQNLLYGTIAMHQARNLGRTAAVDIGPVDIAGIARGLGADSMTVTSSDELDDAFARAAAFDGPRVIAVRTDPDVITPTATLSGLLSRPG